ncbi:PP287 [Orf virus]|uniref:PP287 n=1 Tax=Orf virus TaxID=10258 RepID=F1AXJ9_ORFV|nr:PP287 [Orf virus]
MSNSVRPHRRQPTKLPRSWDSPGKNTGVGFHFLLQCMKVKSESEVAQSCPTFCDPMDCSLPGSSIHGILQAKTLEWVAISFSRGSSSLRD